MEPHLKPHQYYIDLYDRHTVDICRSTETLFDEDETPLPKVKGMGKKEAEVAMAGVKKWYLRMRAGERYLNKDKTVREWMDADRQRDDLLENAQAPEGIRCLTCRNLAKPTFKQLWSRLDKPDRVLFMYDCPNKCVPRRAFFSDGEEWRPKQHLCPKCDLPLDQKEKDDGIKLVSTRTCKKCGYTETDELEWSKKKEEEFDEKFAVDRDRFCLSDEEGRKFADMKYSLERLGTLMEEFKKHEEELAEKLKANPNGFILEGAGRRCAICHNSSREDGSWYDKYGIKCLVCQKAIDEGEIAASLAKDEDSFYTKYDLEHLFNLKGPTLRKWVKDGLIKARNISRYGQGVHETIFLMEDNKGFLPPKKILKSHSVNEVKDGQTWTHMEPWYRFVDPFKHLKKYGIIKHMRVVPPEEMKAREEEEKRKWEEKRARREQIKNVRDAKKRKKK
jgi:hypothetical protein